MAFFVLWPDGQRFGPADEKTLQAWADEGRIHADTDLEEDGTQRRLKAGELSLVFQEQPQPQASPESGPGTVTAEQVHTGFGVPDEFPMSSGSPYPVASTASKAKSDLNTAWGLIVGGFVATFVIGCCCSYGVFLALGMTGTGIYFANKAKKAGEPGADTAFIVGIVAIGLQALLVAAGIALFMFGMLSGFGRP